MLEPQSRRLLLESFAPAPGLRLDWAVGTTYSLDLIALLAAPVAFAFSDWQDREGQPVLEPLALLKATRHYADRMLLFCQAGRIHVPRSYQPLLANLEGSIAEALAPRGGSFHPKVWFLRYLNNDDAVTYRFLCLSRNMTFDRSWDTMLNLEGELSDRKNAIARNHPLGEFVEALPRMVRRGVTPTWRRRIQQLADEIRRVEFAAPEPFEEMKFWPLGIRDTDTWPFPNRIDRLLAISPFVDAGFIKKLASHEAPMQLVSRPESLGCLAPAELSPFEKLWILDETAEPEAVDTDDTGDAIPTETGEASREAAQGSFGDLPLLGLHAKAYVADSGWNAHIWTGSANATSAAFSRNVEFLVELQGKKSRCGTAALLGRPEGGNQPHAACLADLLKPFIPGVPEPDVAADQRAFERLAEVLAKQIAMCAPIARCEPSESDYSLSIRPTKPGKLSVPSGHSLRVWPISFLPGQGRAVDFANETWCSFERVSVIGLTSFFAWQFESADAQFSHQFVLNVPLENAPADRSESILRHLLSDRERVMRFLLLLLMDPDASDFGRFLGKGGDSDDKSSYGHGMFDHTLFESLLRALDQHPEQIDQVELIVGDLERSPEGRQLLPEGFHEVWEPVIQVRRQQREKTTKKQ